MKRHLRSHDREAGDVLSFSAKPESQQRSDSTAAKSIAGHCSLARVMSAENDCTVAKSSESSNYRKVILDDTVDKPMHVKVATVPAEYNAPSQSEFAVASTRSEAQPIRRRVDVIVMHLKARHVRDRTYLSRKTQCIVDELRCLEVADELSLELLMGMVVAAKHFAGTRSPRMPTTGLQQNELMMHTRPDLGNVKRKLFVDEDAKDITMGSDEDTLADQSSSADAAIGVVRGDEQATTIEVLPNNGNGMANLTGVFMSYEADKTLAETGTSDESPSALIVESTTDKLSPEPSTANNVDEKLIETINDDEQWRLDIWRSYGTGETKLLSPMGYQYSPSIAFEQKCPPSVMSPVATWSSSSDDEPWGPDSPNEPLEFDSQLDIPRWPRFVNANGLPLVEGSSEWEQQLQAWRCFRTARLDRSTRKRRHHCRARRDERRQYTGAINRRSQLTFDWDNHQWRPVSIRDVVLPSPPVYSADLLRIRRLMLRKRTLPRGCRLQPPRTTKYRRVPQTTAVDSTEQTCVCQEHSASSSTPDITLTVSDEEL